MTNEKLEQCLAQALEKTAPHDVDGVLSRCEKRKGTEIPMKTKPHSLKKWMAMAACLALLLLCGGGLFLRQANAVASVVSIDVNPSIELRVNQNEKVLACVPMNDDAHAILADMGGGEDLKGAKLDVAVNAIVGSLVRNGYLESISSAIMISVEDRDQSRAHRLQQDLSAAVDGILRDSASQASVLTQTVTQDTSLEKQAKDHHISTGKAALVNRILALNNSLSFEELSRLSIGELKDLAETGAPAMPIGMERALEIALLTCGQSADQLTKQEVDAELDEVPAHYEVELEDRSGTEYEYRIDAYTGAVLTSYVEPDGHDDVDDHDDYDDDHDDDDDDAQPTGSTQPTLVWSGDFSLYITEADQIAFISWAWSLDSSVLYSYDPVTGTLSSRDLGECIQIDGLFTLVRDGSLRYYYSQFKDGERTSWVYDTATDTTTPLTRFDGGLYVSWLSPDGQYWAEQDPSTDDPRLRVSRWEY